MRTLLAVRLCIRSLEASSSIVWHCNDNLALGRPLVWRFERDALGSLMALMALSIKGIVASLLQIIMTQTALVRLAGTTVTPLCKHTHPSGSATARYGCILSLEASSSIVWGASRCNDHLALGTYLF